MDEMRVVFLFGYQPQGDDYTFIPLIAKRDLITLTV